jgi:hypothetical protein
MLGHVLSLPRALTVLFPPQMASRFLAFPMRWRSTLLMPRDPPASLPGSIPTKLLFPYHPMVTPC